MKIELSIEQQNAKDDFREFVLEHISPYANQFDEAEKMPEKVIQLISQNGYWGALIPEEFGGLEMDPITFGLLCEEIGKGSGSLLSILTVHTMLCQALLKWGTSEQKLKWLPGLAKGEILGAFALTEPFIGSDAKNVKTEAIFAENSYKLTGEKKWISFGQIADLFLIIAQIEKKICAFFVERKTPGFSTKPMTGLLGFRSAMLAHLYLNECSIPEENMLGKIGFGFSHIAGTALDHGRYCIAWGSVGIAQACLDASLKYASQRKQFDNYLKDHQLIQEMITNMVANIKAARLLCSSAGYLKQTGDPAMIMETSTSKYFASRIAAKAASDAVQIHGGNGCGNEYPVQRYFRDAKITEIIEGSNQIQQIIIGRSAYFS